MGQSVSTQMADERRALLTEREREILRGDADVTDNYRYSVESRVRTRLRERLEEDIQLLLNNYPEIYDGLVYPAVCQPGPEEDTARREAPDEALAGGPTGEGMDDEEIAAAADRHVEQTTGESEDSDGARKPEEFVDIVDDPDVVSLQNETERREQMIAAGAAAIVLVRDADAPVSTSQFMELYTKYSVSGQSPPGDAERPSKETYWRKTIKPALDAADAEGLVEQQPGTFDWVWTGDEYE